MTHAKYKKKKLKKMIAAKRRISYFCDDVFFYHASLCSPLLVVAQFTPTGGVTGAGVVTGAAGAGAGAPAVVVKICLSPF